MSNVKKLPIRKQQTKQPRQPDYPESDYEQGKDEDRDFGFDGYEGGE